MPSIFRSELMSLWQIFLPPESAYNIIAELGEVGIAHFIDLNPALTPIERKYFNEVKRCDEMERKLNYIETETEKLDIKKLECDLPPSPAEREMIDLEAVIDTAEAELKHVNTNINMLQRNFIELTELNNILEKTKFYFDELEQRAMDTFDDLHEVLPHDGAVQASIKFSFVAGVILNERVPGFERMLWRVCQGNAFVRVVPIEEDILDVVTGNEVRKSVFIIFSQGDQYKLRVKKICDGFRASVYPLPETSSERDELIVGVQTRLADLTIVLNQSKDHRFRLLSESNKKHFIQSAQVKKMKAIYHTLNSFSFDVTQKCLIGECWIPNYAQQNFTETINKTHDVSGSSVPPVLTPVETFSVPPTHYQTNKFSGSFQGIVEAYGLAAYREVNPAIYACVTFPFLFAVMFGDAGHGLIMTIFAAYLCIWEKSIIAKKIKDEIFTIIFGGRYIILCMGIFSMYTGMIYNDVFSKSVNIFGCRWGSNYSDELLVSAATLQLNPDTLNHTDPQDGHNFYRDPYYFGVDPIWQMGLNKLNYLDSYKMKLSVIIGVIHMLAGIIVGLFNFLYFKRYWNIILQWIPQIIFLSLMFGYLDFLIFWKWIKFTPNDAGYAPNLLINLINMYLGKDNELNMYENERDVENIILIILIICIPWLLLIQPFVTRYQFRKAKASKELAELRLIFGDAVNHEGEFEMGEVFVHQCIHTIEFCLGCISYTASYLRLWALSLAHNQLSDVLWTLVMRIAFAIGVTDGYGYGGIILWGIFACWAVLTVGILLVMEGLSAFLHALRLHWVEFQGKFYAGTGYEFVPFSFKKVFSDEDAI